MTRKPINFVKLLCGYKAGWVAISSDFQSVLFAGKSLKPLKKKSERLRKKVYFFPAGKSYGNFIG